jgi:adenine-specific DNA-methyltransferase
MGDFVNSDDTQIRQGCLLDINRVLRSGVDVYFEISPDLSPIPEASVSEWQSKLSFQANLW